MRSNSEKSGSPQALTAAIVFAAIVVAVAGSARATATTTPGQAYATLAATERGRLIAAAVAATRDFLAVERSLLRVAVVAQAGSQAESASTFEPRDRALPPVRSLRLSPRLTDLPPPIC